MTNVPIITLQDPRFEEDRYGAIEELRAQSFYARTPEGAVVFLNQEDGVEVMRCQDFRFTFNDIDEERSPYLAKAIQHELLNMHSDQHERLSRLLKQALRNRIIEGMREKITQVCADLIAAMPEDGEVDFCSALADPLPARILGPMFDVPYEQAEGLNEWIKVGGRKIDALQSGVGIKEVEDANRAMHSFLRDLLRSRRAAPGEDLFSELIVAEIDGDRMSEDEVVYLSAELAAAGVDTTRTQLPLVLLELLRHPEELLKLRADPGLALRAVDEGMRFAPLPWAIPHAACRDFTYKGISFKEGDLAFPLIPAMNRDPEKVPDPQVFDISRDRIRNFSFGSGLHACPGSQLARMEMSIALQAFVQAFAQIDLAGAPDWEPGQKDRGLASLRLKVRKR